MPTNSDTKQLPSRQQFAQILRTVHELSPTLFPVLLVTALLTTIQPYFSSTLLAWIIDAFSTSGGSARLPVLLGGFLVGAYAINLLSAWFRTKITVIKGQLHLSFTRRITTTTLKLDYAQLESPAVAMMRTKGITALTYNNTLNKVIDGLFSSVLSVVLAAIFTVVTLISLLSTTSNQTTALASFTGSIWYAGLLLLCLLVPLVLVFVLARRNRQIQQANMESSAQFNQAGSYYDNQVLLDDQAGATFRAFDAGPAFLTWITATFKTGPMVKLVSARRKQALSTALLQASLILVTILLYLLVILKARVHAISTGQIILHVGYLQSFISVVNANVLQWNDGLAVLGYLETLVEYINLPMTNSLAEPKQQDNPAEQAAPSVTNHAQGLTISHVWFRYTEDADWILRDVNLTLQQGESLALVGRNGSGKTTLIKLICGLYHPSRGQILLNGMNIATMDSADYRSQLGVVFQDFALLAYSVGENIAASTEQVSEKVWQALHAGGVDDLIRTQPAQLATGITTELDPAGKKFSGGQSQKLAIARAHYKDSPLLLLDEPTAALDPQSEAEIYARLQTMKAGRMAVFVSHRMGSCKFCDRIAVLDAGGVIQSGNHAELMRDKDGLYAQLFTAQAQYYQD